MAAATRRRRVLQAAALALLGVVVCLGASPARANDVHVVRAGDSLSGIAARAHVSVSSLAALNGLRRTETLTPGQRLELPERGVVYVAAGQTLTSIAQANGVSVEALARANDLRIDAPLGIQQAIKIPGVYQTAHHDPRSAAHRPEPAAVRGASAGSGAGAERDTRGAPARLGLVHIGRTLSDEQAYVRLLDASGAVVPSGRAELGQLMRDRRSGVSFPPDPRLVEVLAKLSEHFGGRTLFIVNGYEAPDGTGAHRRHARGQAVDIRIAGVPNTALRDAARAMPGVGVGYFPNDTFVHIDVRERAAAWVDYAGPGEPSRFGGLASARALTAASPGTSPSGGAAPVAPAAADVGGGDSAD
ncbi:MAG: LysM peptidoglycan-binding domain-containing protein [Myxococcales bacterium]|nr:LysM peptidoglycan-binding domain-containing protein [Myxococcales bacterium]